MSGDCCRCKYAELSGGVFTNTSVWALPRKGQIAHAGSLLDLEKEVLFSQSYVLIKSVLDLDRSAGQVEIPQKRTKFPILTLLSTSEWSTHMLTRVKKS